MDTEDSTPTKLKTQPIDVSIVGKEVDNDPDSAREPRDGDQDVPSMHAVTNSRSHLTDLSPTRQVADAIQLCETVPPKVPAFKAWTTHSVLDRHRSHYDGVRWKLKSQTGSSVGPPEQAQLAGQFKTNRISDQMLVPEHGLPNLREAARHPLSYQGQAGGSEKVYSKCKSMADPQHSSTAMFHGTEKVTRNVQATQQPSRRVTGLLPRLDIRRQAIGFEHLLLRKASLPR